MMNLEQYRMRVKRSMWGLRGMVLVFLAVGFGCHVMDDSYAVHMMAGMAVGGGLMTLGVMARYGRALKDDTLLRRLYNEKHDERKQAIRAKAGLPMGLYMALGLIVAAMIAAPLNETVMLTLMAVAVAQLLICCVVKMICLRSM